MWPTKRHGPPPMNSKRLQILVILLIVLAGALVFRLVRGDYRERTPFASPGRGMAGAGIFNVKDPVIPADAIRWGGPPKDGIPALADPAMVTAADASFMEDADLVVGVSIAGEARAYPLRILVWHEIANDTVGDTPVAVTYCPLCQSTMVFDRRIGGRTNEFGVSGLLYQSNVLMFDRREDPDEESLWSQGEMRAVAGPAAKKELTLSLMPSELTTWEDWRARHPETQVMSTLTGHFRDYNGSPYEGYFVDDHIMFPVKSELEKPERFRQKEMLAVVYADGAAKAYAVRDVERAAGEGGLLEDTIQAQAIRITHVPEGPSIRAADANSGETLPVAYMFWFVLSAMQPNIPVFEP